jgi:hypothetical protein
MSKRLTTLVTAAVLTAAPVGIVVTASPATAADCTAPKTRLHVSPRPVVVDTTGSQGFDVVLRVSAGGCTVTAVDGSLSTPSRTTTALTLTNAGTVAGVTTYTARVDLTAAQLASADAGTWRVRTATHWAQQQSTSDDAAGESQTEVDEAATATAKVSVVAAANLTADATSSQLKKGRITKGRVLTVQGVLTRADWTSGIYTGYAKQKVDLQFRTAKGRFKKVTSVRTRAGGAFAAAVKVSKDGCYRVVYTGSRTTAPVPSKAECIDVR